MFRVGTGFDIHRVAAGNGLNICGVFIDAEFGVEAHSDGDVGLHALMDAMLGAASLGDIGLYFPPSDEKWRGADSKKLLQQVVQLVHNSNYVVENVDVTILCEKPKIGPYREQMKGSISEILAIAVECVNIKATTMEGLGAIGRHEGIAAHAVCLIRRILNQEK